MPQCPSNYNHSHHGFVWCKHPVGHDGHHEAEMGWLWGEGKYSTPKPAGDIHLLNHLVLPAGWSHYGRAFAIRDEIVVMRTDDGGFNSSVRPNDEYPTVAEACAAAERAYCGAYVGQPLPRDCAICCASDCPSRNLQTKCPCPEKQS